MPDSTTKIGGLQPENLEPLNPKAVSMPQAFGGRGPPNPSDPNAHSHKALHDLGILSGRMASGTP